MREAKDATNEWRQNAEEDYAFFSGDQWNDEDMSILEEQGRPAVVFNRVARTINAVSGTEIQNRQEVRYIPREAGDAGVNDVQTQAAEWVRDNCDAEDEESEAFKDLLICGIGSTITRLEHEEDPDGKILIERVDPLEIFWDASAKKRNLIDKRWVALVRKVSMDEFREEFPGVSVDSKGEEWLDLEDDPHDASPPYYNGNDGGANQPKNIEVVEFQYYKKERFARARWIDGSVKEFPARLYDTLKPRLEAMGLPCVLQSRRKYFKLIFQGNTALDHMPLESQEDFTIQIKTGMRDRNRNTWFGLVRMMVDPQRLANKFFSQMIHIVNTSAKSGVIVEESAVPNMRTFEDEWAKAGSISKVADGALSNGKIQEKQASNFPASMDRLLQYSVEAINDIPGVNAELMGITDYTGQSGVLEHQRKQAGITLLAVFFDSLRRYRKSQGRLLAELIRKYIPEGTLIRLVNKEGQQYIPLTKDALSMKFDVIVDDAPTSPNMKEKTFGILQSLLPQMLQAGIPIPAEVIDYAPLPESLITAWKQQLQKPPEQAQKEAQKEAIVDQAMIAETEKDKAQAEKYRAEAMETASKVSNNVVGVKKTLAETEETQVDTAIKRRYPLQ